MVYIKLYDNFLDLFKSKKKMPIEVIEFSNKLFNFIKDLGILHYSNLFISPDKRYSNKIEVDSDCSDTEVISIHSGTSRYFDIRYDNSLNYVKIVFHPRDILSDVGNYLSMLIKEDDYFLSGDYGSFEFNFRLGKLSRITSKLDIEEFELWRDVSKYNL